MNNVKNPYYPRPSVGRLWDAINVKNILARQVANSNATPWEKHCMLTHLQDIELIIGTQNLPSARDEFDHEIAKQDFRNLLDQHEDCKAEGKNKFKTVMVDVDGTNLEEVKECKNCGYREPVN